MAKEDVEKYSFNLKGYRDANHEHTISFENYFVNDYKTEGTEK